MVPAPPDPDPFAHPPGAPPELADLAVLGLEGVDVGATRAETLLRRTEKSLLATGRNAGRRVVLKVLTTDDPFWRSTLAREIGIYRALGATPAPVRTPRLVHTDGARVLVIEHLPGRLLASDRYPARALTDDELATALSTVAGFSAWSPPPGTLTPTFDYLDRLHRYGHLLDLGTLAALRRLATELGEPRAVAHGDPLPSNLLLVPGSGTGPGTVGFGSSGALLDFEFTGLFLPGFDLAMLQVLLAATPGAAPAIRAAAAAAGVDEPAWLVNLAVVLTRELRIHRELDDGPLRRERLALIEPQLRILDDALQEYL